MAKLNYRLLPVKAHYFFFFASTGPILPFLPIFGKNMGISEVAMGGLYGTIPYLFFILKPVFGYIVDYFQEKRKCIFMMLIFLMGLSFFLMGYLPDGKYIVEMSLPYQDIKRCDTDVKDLTPVILKCENHSENILKDELHFCTVNDGSSTGNCTAYFTQRPSELYTGFSFWTFAILISFGSISFNIANSVSDAICFDVLGEGNETFYGNQRVWGTIGYGFSAMIAGYFLNSVESEPLMRMKDFLPAFFMCALCVISDLACCLKLKLPPLPTSKNILKDIWVLAKQPRMALFLLFAVFVGMCDSSYMFYLLWYLEDIAKESVGPVNMKLLQGLTVAVESLIGEVVFFSLSGKIVGRIGYGACLSLCFGVYGIRLMLIALIPSPWWILPIEALLHGPSYALCYTTIVAYASAVAPPGTSATVQGVVAGMDDGFGFAFGSMIGSVIYKYYGGRVMFISAAALAFFSCITHTALYFLFFRNTLHKQGRRSDPKAGNDEDIERESVPLKTH